MAFALFSFTRPPHWAHLALACILSLGTASLDVAVAWILGRFFDDFSRLGLASTVGNVRGAELSFNLWCLLAAAFMKLLFNGGFSTSWVYFGEQQVECARRSLFQGLLGRNIAWHEAQNGGVGALLLNTQSHLLHFGAGTSQSMGMALHSLISAIISMALGMYLIWDVTIITLLPLPLAFASMTHLSRRISCVLAARNAGMGRASATVANALSAIDTVYCCNGQASETCKYDIALRMASKAHAHFSLLSGLQIAIARFTSLAMFSLGLWYGIYAVTAGRRTPGELLTTFWACLIATQSIEGLASLVPILLRGNVSAQALNHLSDSGGQFRDKIRSISAASHQLNGKINIRNVSFSYDELGRERALQNISMCFLPATTTFVIGTSGSGKTTLASLLMGFYQPQGGSILLDDNHLNARDAEWLREHITLSSSSPELLRASIIQNILISKGNSRRPSHEQIQDCLEFSGLTDFIQRLPRGLNTRVGHGGTRLSGGQCQRIGLARAKLRDTPILILDETMSALDVKSRHVFMHRLRKWRRNKTTIIITHDYSHIMDTDHVYCLHNGHITEQGVWSQLSQHLSPATSPKRSSETSSTGEDQRRTAAFEHSIPEISMPPTPRLSITSAMLAPLSPATQSPSPQLHCSSTIAASCHSDCEAEVVELRRAETIKGRLSNQPCVKTLTLMKILRTVWPSLDRRGRCELVAGTLCAIMHALTNPLFAFSFARVLQAFELPAGQAAGHARSWILTIASLAVYDATLAFVTHGCYESASRKWSDALRLRSLQMVLRQPRRWFDDARNSVDQIDSCLDKSAEEMRDLICNFVATALVCICLVTTAMLWSMILCSRLAFVGIIVVPPLFFLSQSFEKSNRIWDARSHEAGVAAAEVLNEACTNIRTVHAFNLQSKLRGRYIQLLHKALQIGHARAWRIGLYIGVMDAGMVLCQALIFWYGSALVLNWGASVDTIVAVFSILLFSISTSNAMVASIPQISSGQAAASRLLRLSRLPKAHFQPTQASIHVSHIPTDIRFSNFSLRYQSRPSKYALRFLDLEIFPGMATGLVGTSGSGKTTVLSALLGLYGGESSKQTDLQGALLLGQHQISAYDLPMLRSCIGYVPQTVQLFPDTVANNILYGTEYSFSALQHLPVEEAASMAGIDAFIQSLPSGYETRIGEGGLGLSLGQTQRIGIARAIARRPELLLMDEPTSNLDIAAAAHIRQTIATLVQQGTTTVVVTHSTSMMAALDRLVVLDAGQAIEEGTWDELMKRDRSHLRRLLECNEIPMETLSRMGKTTDERC